MTSGRPAWVHVVVVDCDGRGKIEARCAKCGQVEITWSGTRIVCPNAKDVPSGYRHLVGDKCERCGFVPEHRMQLEGHHRDHDRYNNVPENIATLCANCHRLHHALCERRKTKVKRCTFE